MKILTMLLVLFSGVFTDPPREKVADVVKWQMLHYPESRLIDYYKNFFQDKFGPGHMVTDTASAGAYLRKELAQMPSDNFPDDQRVCISNDASEKATSDYIEFTGWEHNFMRVDLYLVKNGIIPYDKFFEAFLESVKTGPVVSHEDWIKEWNSIVGVISDINRKMPDFKADSVNISKMLSQGEYVVHHSAVYENVYKPHYRLISKSVFDRKLSSYLK